jgi:hypothetical protein
MGVRPGGSSSMVETADRRGAHDQDVEGAAGLCVAPL